MITSISFQPLRNRASRWQLWRHDGHIRQHLHRIENELRSRDASHLPPEQQAARVRSLDRLCAYWQRGVFPRNRVCPDESRPCFIDAEGRACAVADLVIGSGQVDTARWIAERANMAYVNEMLFPELDAWAESCGLTREELALIQPSYPYLAEPELTSLVTSVQQTMAFTQYAILAGVAIAVANLFQTLRFRRNVIGWSLALILMIALLSMGRFLAGSIDQGNTLIQNPHIVQAEGPEGWKNKGLHSGPVRQWWVDNQALIPATSQLAIRVAGVCLLTLLLNLAAAWIGRKGIWQPSHPYGDWRQANLMLLLIASVLPELYVWFQPVTIGERFSFALKWTDTPIVLAGIALLNLPWLLYLLISGWSLHTGRQTQWMTSRLGTLALSIPWLGLIIRLFYDTPQWDHWVILVGLASSFALELHQAGTLRFHRLRPENQAS